MTKTRLVIAILLSVSGLAAVSAPSASAFGWWKEVGEGKEVLLLAGEKLPFNEAGKVGETFVLKWNKEFEIECSATNFTGGFLEGTVKLGIESIKFSKCILKSPSICKLAKEEINTGKLLGEINPNGTTVEFKLTAGGNFAEFELVGSLCSFGKTIVTGFLRGEIPEAAKLSKEKAFAFFENKETLKVAEHPDERAKGKDNYSGPTGWSAH